MTQSSSAAFADSKPHYRLLDGLRGVAAIMVIWYHIFEAFATSPYDQGFNHGYLAPEATDSPAADGGDGCATGDCHFLDCGKGDVERCHLTPIDGDAGDADAHVLDSGTSGCGG